MFEPAIGLEEAAGMAEVTGSDGRFARKHSKHMSCIEHVQDSTSVGIEAVLELHVNSTLASSGASRGSGDQVPCTGSSGRRETAYWRVPSATEGRQAVTRTGRVALLDPAEIQGQPLTHDSRRFADDGQGTRTGGLNADVAEDADGSLPRLADVETGVPATSRLAQFAHGVSQGNWSAVRDSCPAD